MRLVMRSRCGATDGFASVASPVPPLISPRRGGTACRTTTRVAPRPWSRLAAAYRGSMPSLATAPGIATRPTEGGRRLVSPATALFLGLFASQAGVLVLSLILVDVARDFDVSTAVAGQLRLAAAPLAAIVAVAVARAGRLPLRSLLVAGAVLVAVGSLASAAAPSFTLLALAQVPTWAGAAILVAGGVGASGSWGPAEERGRTMARALAGPPAAWIVGMPLVGVVAEVNWRLAFLALPLPAALLALAAVAAQPAVRDHRPGASLGRLLRRPGALGWATGELAANAAWTGTLAFSGALLVEGHGVSRTAAGALLALVAVAYLAGNQRAPRVEPGRTHRALVRGDVAAAVAVALLWAVTPNLITTVLFFSVAAYAAAARTLWGTSYGFVVAGERKLEAGAARAVTNQLGYLVGSALGGAALATGGYALMGLVFAALFAAAALPHVCLTRRRCAGRGRLSVDAVAAAAAP
jgi:DHA1 family inner membrane transport protein